MSCKCLPECGWGIAYGCDCCGRLQKFGSEIIFQVGRYPEFDYFKKFQVFDFLKSLALAKSCHKKMRSGGKIFKICLFPPEIFKILFPPFSTLLVPTKSELIFLKMAGC